MIFECVGASPEYTWVSKATSIAAANVRPFGTDSILAASGSSLVYPTPVSFVCSHLYGVTKIISYGSIVALLTENCGWSHVL